jgi:hypothetical protein
MKKLFSGIHQKKSFQNIFSIYAMHIFKKCSAVPRSQKSTQYSRFSVQILRNTMFRSCLSGSGSAAGGLSFGLFSIRSQSVHKIFI